MTARARRSGLVAACDDRQLLDVDLWPTQRRMLEAVESGPRIHVWALGRRSAKTTSAAIVGLWDCLLRPHLQANVRPGERRYSVAVATNHRQARLFVQAARAIVQRSPLLAALVEQIADDEISFRNGTALAAFPCTSRGARGWPISTLLLDEFAHHVDGDGNSAAESVWRSLVPSTAQFGTDARVIVASTPWGADGLFADLYQRAHDAEIPDAIAQHATSAEANPTLDPDFLRAEFERDPDGFASEYEAHFLGSGGAYLDPQRIADAVTLPGELDPNATEGWIAALDPAFSSDPFGLAIVARVPQRHDAPDRLVLGLARAWQPSRGASFVQQRNRQDEVLAEVAEVCHRYRARVVTDQFAAPAIVDYLSRRGLAVETVPMTAASKTAAFAELRAQLNAGVVDLYRHADLLAELRRLRSRFTAGTAAVVNPRVGGSHGDLAQALALAVYEHRHGIAAEAPTIGGSVRADTWSLDTPWGSPKLQPSMRL